MLREFQPRGANARASEYPSGLFHTVAGNCPQRTAGAFRGAAGPQQVAVILVQDVYQKSTNDSSTRALCSRINALRQAFSMRGRQVSQSFTFSS